MLNHTYTSVKNANLVDCGKKTHIASQPSPLLKDNFLGEFRTELDKKKVLANLGVATDLSLEWEYIKGDIGNSVALMKELDSRTTYTTQIGEFKDQVITVIEGLQYLETITGQEGEEKQNERIQALEDSLQEVVDGLESVNKYLQETIELDIDELQKSLEEVTEQVANIDALINISSKADNALISIPEGSDLLAEGETSGLYVPNLEPRVKSAEDRFQPIETNVENIQKELSNFVTKEDLGGDSFDFVESSEFEQYTSTTDQSISDIVEELKNTVKTGEDGHVDTLYVNTISKNNNNDNIKITDSFEVTEGIPLDIRFVVETMSQLLSLPVNVCYSGMGVIVNESSSLYILRKPQGNDSLTQEYIGNIYNWKCPEDLVIEVITQEEYDRRDEEGSLNPNMFYYIHEEVVEEPLRKDFDSDEAYATALDKWLRVLQQKYMSAVWGEEIESLVASKASTTAVKNLETEIQRLDSVIKSLSGGSSEVNLKDLNTQVQTNTDNIDNLINEEDGLIPQIQKGISDLSKDLSDNYVTKLDITVENPETEYIFVKKSDFATYKNQHDADVAAKVTTEQLYANTITLGDNVLVTEEGVLKLDSENIAFENQIPVIELIDNDVFKDIPEESKGDQYYYVYDLEERYILNSDYTKDQEVLSQKLKTISDRSIANETFIGVLTNLKTENKNNLVYSLNELHDYISRLDDSLDVLITDEGVINSIQKVISDLSAEISQKYVTIESITKDDPTGYIFLKNSDFNEYKTAHQAQTAEQVTTKTLTTEKIVLGENELTSDESGILFNDSKLAFEEQVPNIVLMDNATFNTTEEFDSDTYYYVFDTGSYVLSSDFETYKKQQSSSLSTQSTDINTNKVNIGTLSNLLTDNKNTLVLAINELVNKVNALTLELNSIKAQLPSSEPES